jgi:CheY-like chemotaxis protein
MKSSVKKILVIEDNPDIRENISELLELAGYEVLSAQNGSEGLSALAENPPHAVLCDIMMPHTDGYEVLRTIKGQPATLHIPFIFVTASAEKSEINTAMKMGADGYICKPFDAGDITTLLDKFLK